VPTDWPEADGTLSWNSTTIVLVLLHRRRRDRNRLCPRPRGPDERHLIPSQDPVNGLVFKESDARSYRV
jgi:hypothetical protein